MRWLCGGGGCVGSVVVVLRVATRRVAGNQYMRLRPGKEQAADQCASLCLTIMKQKKIMLSHCFFNLELTLSLFSSL